MLNLIFFPFLFALPFLHTGSTLLSLHSFQIACRGFFLLRFPLWNGVLTLHVAFLHPPLYHRLDHWKGYGDCCKENRVFGEYSGMSYCAVFNTIDDLGTAPEGTSGIP